jgi:hypothetical protein
MTMVDFLIWLMQGIFVLTIHRYVYKQTKFGRK